MRQSPAGLGASGGRCVRPWASACAAWRRGAVGSGGPRGSRRIGARALGGLIGLWLLASGCGAGDALPPEPQVDEVAAAARCPPIDAYLSDLYALADAGELAGLAAVVREAFPEDVRRDLVEALLRLLGGLERGALGRIATAAYSIPETADQGDGGLQPRLGRVVRWLVTPAPRTDALALARRVVATCEGGPPLALIGRLLADGPLVEALLSLLTSQTVSDALSTLSVTSGDAVTSGREAVAALVRNLLLAATQPSFRVETVTGLLGLVVDLDAPAWAPLVDGLARLLDADGLAAAQGLLACLHRADPERVLGGTLYDLLTSGVLRQTEQEAAPDPSAPDGKEDLARDALIAALREAARQLAVALAADPVARRGLAEGLDVFLAPEHAGPALGDVATLLAASAFDGLLDLVLDLVSGRCER